MVPTTLINSEYTALGSYLAQAQSIYGFREIVVEWGNENWNSVFRAAGIQDPVVMAQVANTGFALIRQAAGPLTPLHMVVNGQFVNPWIGQQAILHAPQADGVDVAPYYFYTLDNGTAQSTAIAQMLNDSDESPLIAQLAATTQPLNKSIGVYEVNASTTQGSAPQAQRDPLVAGEISGTALAARLLTGINTGVKRQLVWNLAQFDLCTANGVTALYGIAHDLTASSNFRPTGLAVEMLNTAISGDLYPVTVTGADGLTAAAFLSSAGWAMAITSSSPAAITVGITLPSTGTPPSRIMQLLAPHLTSTNEAGQQVTINAGSLGNNLQVGIPPFGLVILRCRPATLHKAARASRPARRPLGSGSFL